MRLSEVQIAGGDYSNSSLYYICLDLEIYKLYYYIDNYQYNLCEFSTFLEFLKRSAFEAETLCENILCDIVMNCHWSDLDFYRQIKAKFRILGIERDKFDYYLRLEVRKFMSSDNFEEFTFNCLMKVCSDAKVHNVF